MGSLGTGTLSGAGAGGGHLLLPSFAACGDARRVGYRIGGPFHHVPQHGLPGACDDDHDLLSYLLGRQ